MYLSVLRIEPGYSQILTFDEAVDHVAKKVQDVGQEFFLVNWRKDTVVSF